jgi:hypothetical protein
MKHPLLTCAFVGLMMHVSHSATAAPSAQPDSALVARYEANESEFKAKVAECRAKKDLAEVLTDVGCMSAQEVSRKESKANLAIHCRVADLYVTVPPGLSDDAIRSYLQNNTPSEDALKRCNRSKEQWLQDEFRAATKKR